MSASQWQTRGVYIGGVTAALILSLLGGVTASQLAASGVANNPTTTPGDLIVRGDAGTLARLGTSGASDGGVLTVAGGAVQWAAAPTAALPAASAAGEMLVSDGAGSDYTATAAAGVRAAINAAANPLTAYDGTSSAGFTASAGSAGGTASITSGAFRIVQPAGDARHNSAGGYQSAVIYRALGVAGGDFDVAVRIAAMPAVSTSQAFLVISDATSAGNRLAVIAADNGTVYAFDPTANAVITTAASRFGSYTGEEWLRLSVRGLSVSFYTGVGTGGARPTAWTPIGSAATASAAVWSHVTLTLVAVSTASEATLDLDDLTIVDRSGGL